jgi:hypothetical protein
VEAERRVEASRLVEIGVEAVSAPNQVPPILSGFFSDGENATGQKSAGSPSAMWGLAVGIVVALVIFLIMLSLSH